MNVSEEEARALEAHVVQAIEAAHFVFPLEEGPVALRCPGRLGPESYRLLERWFAVVLERLRPGPETAEEQP